jgi:hypothetical protein
MDTNVSENKSWAKDWLKRMLEGLNKWWCDATMPGTGRIGFAKVKVTYHPILPWAQATI